MESLGKDQVLQRLEAGQTIRPNLAYPALWIEIEEMDFTGHVFTQPVDFSNAKFKGPVKFKGARFEKGLRFFDCQFDGDADFSWCDIRGKAYFWRSRFLGATSFADTTIVASEEPGNPQIYPGEANFSWAFFGKGVSFQRTRFAGKAWFWRTVFCAVILPDSTLDVTFEEAKFECGVLFEGTEHEICVSASDFGNPITLNKLILCGIMLPDSETSPARYWHFKDVRSPEQLREILAKKGFDSGYVEDVASVWIRLARKMFAGSDNSPVSFQHVFFAKPDETQFRRVDLSRCLLADCDVSKLDFTDVHWDCEPTMMWFGRRRAVRDERFARTEAEYRLLEKVYRELRKNYEGKGAYAEAGDFHFGEMEMRRLIQRGVLRHVSLTAIYKYLSGYGERHGLALSWLLLFIFVLFPALYLLVGAFDGPLAAVLHSLEVATFLKPESAAPVSLAGRFLEGAERIVVSLQAGLFLLAVKRNYARQ